MINENMRKIAILFALLFLMCLASCASQASQQMSNSDGSKYDWYLGDLSPIQPPIPENLKVNLGKIGVASSYYLPESIFHTPVSKEGGALRGAGAGFFGSLVAVCPALGPGGCIAGIFVAPAAGLVGGIAGAATGENPEKTVEAEKVLKDYVSRLVLHQALREKVLLLNKVSTHYPFVQIVKQGPARLDEKVNYDFKIYDIDTIVEIGITKINLLGIKGNINPDDILYVTGVSTIISRLDDKVIYKFNIVYCKSNTHKFSEWSADDGKLFKEEVDKAVDFIANKILEVLRQIQYPSKNQPPSVSLPDQGS